MTLWIAIVLVALGSYAFRVVPFLLNERIRLSPRADDVLRHASVAAMTAMLATGVQHLSVDSNPRDRAARYPGRGCDVRGGDGPCPCVDRVVGAPRPVQGPVGCVRLW